MYGWIETGGFFKDTSSNDIVFRTAGFDQLISIGNSTLSNERAAALYIKHNNVGINCVTSNDDVKLVVNGASLFTQGILSAHHVPSNARMQLDGSELRFVGNYGTSNAKDTVYVNTYDSRVCADSIVTKNILTQKRALSGVLVYEIKNVEIQENAGEPIIPGYDLTINTEYQEYFVDGAVFMINRRSYQVWQIVPSVSGKLTLRIFPYSRYTPYGNIDFQEGDTLDIQLLDDWTPIDIASRVESVSFRVCVDSFELNHVTTSPSTEVFSNALLEVRMYFRNRTHNFYETPIPGDFFVFTGNTTEVAKSVSPRIILKLLSYKQYIAGNGQQGFIMSFVSADSRACNLTELVPFLQSPLPGTPKTTYLVPLVHARPPTIVDENVVVGYTINPLTSQLGYQLVNTRMSKYVAKEGSYGVITITLGMRASKHVVRSGKPYDADTVVLETYGGVDDAIFNVQTQLVTYTLQGVPIVVEGYEALGDDIHKVKVSTDFDDLMHNYSAIYTGHYLLWMDELTTCHMRLQKLTYDDDHGFFEFVLQGSPVKMISQDSILFILPFKYTNHVRVGEPIYNAYLPSTVSVGTQKVRESLTVNGNASVVRDMCIYNRLSRDDRDNKFIMSFSDDCVLDLDSKVRIAPSKVYIKRPIEVVGAVTAVDFLQYSDVRLKSNILESESKTDLDKVCQLSVKTFNINNNKSISKGVIAQEIRDIFPEALSTVPDIIPCGMLLLATIDRNDNCLVVNQLPQHAKVGNIIRITPVGSSREDVETFDLRILDIVSCPRFDVESKQVVHKIYTEPEALHIGSSMQSVKVLGVVDDILLVNYEVLYMSAVNAIKELKAEIDALRLLHLDASKIECCL